MEQDHPNRPRRHVRLYGPQFADLVAAGLKRQTIRANPRRERDRPRVGDIIDNRAWRGVPYRPGSTHRRLGAGTITRVTPIVLLCDCQIVRLAGQKLTPAQIGAIALQDGFPSLAEFWRYFRAACPAEPIFRGHLIVWLPRNRLPEAMR